MGQPSTSILDNFNRADVNPLSPGWSNWFFGAGNFKLVSNEILPQGGWAGALYGTTFTADQELYITQTNTATGSIELYLRIQADINDFYMFSVYDGDATISYVADGSPTDLLAGSHATISNMSAGDKYWFKAIGNVLTISRYTVASGVWTDLLTATDSLYTAGGYIGIANTNINFDDFGGGDVVVVNGATGTLSKTLGGLTRSVAGTVLLQGSTSKSLGALGRSASGQVLVKGSTSKSLGSLNRAISTGVLVQATTTKTLGSITKSISGSVLNNASLTKTLGSITGVLSGQSIVGASLSKTLSPITKSLSGTVQVSGTTNKTLGGLTKTISGIVLVNGSLTKTLGAVTLSSSVSIGTVVITASLDKTLGSLTDTIIGNVVVNGTLSYLLGSLGITSSGTAGYPAVNQEGFRFRYDDGSESTATWIEAQDTATKTAVQEPFRLRVLVDSESDVNSDFQIEYRKLLSTSPVLWGEWKKV